MIPAEHRDSNLRTIETYIPRRATSQGIDRTIGTVKKRGEEWTRRQRDNHSSQGYLVPPCFRIPSIISITRNVSLQGMCWLSLRPRAISAAVLSASHTKPWPMLLSSNSCLLPSAFPSVWFGSPSSLGYTTIATGTLGTGPSTSIYPFVPSSVQ